MTHSILVQVNSKLSHDIKKNDFSLSHMVKNYEGRKQFLRTIELVRKTFQKRLKDKLLKQKNKMFPGLKVAFFQDINRAESYGKRMQKEFEREYETVGICQDIISASEEGEEEESREGEGESDKEQKSILSERENVQNRDKDKDVLGKENDIPNANQDEIEAEKEKTSSSKSALLTEEIISSSFQVSATTDPFGL